MSNMVGHVGSAVLSQQW